MCYKCSDHKAPLRYDSNRLNKVCKDCYLTLTGRADTEEPVAGKKRGILEVLVIDVFYSFCLSEPLLIFLLLTFTRLKPLRSQETVSYAASCSTVTELNRVRGSGV